jgi:hypothetical protein
MSDDISELLARNGLTAEDLHWMRSSVGPMEPTRRKYLEAIQRNIAEARRCRNAGTTELEILAIEYDRAAYDMLAAVLK